MGQGPVDSLEDILPILIKVSEGLIVSGLNIHCYDILLLSEALSFYEQVRAKIERYKNMLTYLLCSVRSEISSLQYLGLLVGRPK